MNSGHGLLQGRAITGGSTALSAHGKFVGLVKRIAVSSATTRIPEDSTGAWSSAGCESISVRPKAGNLPKHNRSYHRTMTELLARVNVGEVNLDRRSANSG